MWKYVKVLIKIITVLPIIIKGLNVILEELKKEKIFEEQGL